MPSAARCGTSTLGFPAPLALVPSPSPPLPKVDPPLLGLLLEALNRGVKEGRRGWQPWKFNRPSDICLSDEVAAGAL